MRIKTEEVDPELAKAVDSTIELIEKTPYSAVLRGRLAMTYEVNHFPDAALEMYAQAALLDSQEFAWWYFGALLEQKRGDFVAAVSKLEHAIDIDANYVPAHLHMGNWLLEQNHFDRALDSFNTAASLGAGSPAAVGIAQTYLRQDNFESVVDVLVPYSKSLPHPQIWRLLGLAYDRLGLEEEASIAKALSKEALPMLWLDPIRQRPNRYVKGFGRRIVYAQSLLKAERYSDALRELEKLHEFQPNDEALISSLAVAYEKTGQSERAKEILQSGINRIPGQHRFYVQLGDLMYRTGNNERALTLITQSIEMSEANPEAHERLGAVLMRMERFEESVAAFTKAIDYGHANVSDIHLRMGTIHGARGDWKNAVEQFRKVVDLDPSNIDGHVYLAHAYIASDQLLEAEETVDWAVRLGLDSVAFETVRSAIVEGRNNSESDTQ